MPTTLRNTDILFNDGTTQSSAATPLPSGSADVNSAVDITLTSASAPIQNVCMTTTGRSITLPNATTLTTRASRTFMIFNYGSTTISVRDSSGSYLGGPAAYTLVNNATSRGIWAGAESPALINSFINPITTSSIYCARYLVTGNSYGAYYLDAVPIASDKALIFYSANPNGTTTDVVGYSSVPGIDVWAVVATVSGTTITFGTSVRVFNNLAPTTMCAAGWSNGSAILIKDNLAWGISVSGTTITVGSQTTINNGGGNICYTGTQGTLIVYSRPVAAIAACVVQVSGTTVTSGTNVTVVSGGNGNIPSVGMIGHAGNDNYIAVMSPDNVGYNTIYNRAFSISGTTITLGSTTTSTVVGTSLSLQNGEPSNWYSPSTGTVVFNFTNGGYLFTYSGTTYSNYATVPGGSGNGYSTLGAVRAVGQYWAYTQSTLTTNHFTRTNGQSTGTVSQYLGGSYYTYTNFGGGFSAPNYYTAGGSGSSYSGAAPWVGGFCVLPNGTIFMAGVNGTSSTTSYVAATTATVLK